MIKENLILGTFYSPPVPWGGSPGYFFQDQGELVAKLVGDEPPNSQKRFQSAAVATATPRAATVSNDPQSLTTVGLTGNTRERRATSRAHTFATEEESSSVGTTTILSNYDPEKGQLGNDQK